MTLAKVEYVMMNGANFQNLDAVSIDSIIQNSQSYCFYQKQALV